MKLKYCSILVLLLAALYFVPSAESEEEPAGEVNCEEVIANLKKLKSEYNAAYKEQKKAFEKWQKYYEQLHSFSYENTDQPLMDSYNKCKEGDYLGKDFCKGVFENYDEITANEVPAKQAYDSAEKNANEIRRQYNIAVRTASDQGCNPKK